jgi:hypothetical protein
MNKVFSNLRAIFPILLIVILLSPDSSYSQVKKYTSGKFKPSRITIEVLFSYSQPLPNMFGEVGDLFSFKSYGVKYGLGSQINVKLSANKKGKIRPYISLGYALFMGKNNGTAFIDSNKTGKFPLPGSASFFSTSGNSRIFLHNFNIGPGFEYAFVNKTRWTPHIGAELDLNILFGTYRQTPDNSAGLGPEGQVSFTIKQAVRFGFGFGGGIHLRVHKVLGFAFCTKYKFADVLGKSSNRITEENKMELLDKSATDLNTNLSKDRHINYFEFMLGLVFHIGKL